MLDINDKDPIKAEASMINNNKRVIDRFDKSDTK